jgi:hypothetical protein
VLDYFLCGVRAADGGRSGRTGAMADGCAQLRPRRAPLLGLRGPGLRIFSRGGCSLSVQRAACAVSRSRSP